ncbi:MAG: alpha/beta fold hydrolase, partial [Flavobacterium sp.]
FSTFQPQHPEQKAQERKAKAYHIERLLLKRTGLQLDTELKVFDVPILFQGEDHYLHTYLCGEQNKRTLVLLHGYGGSSTLFYAVLKDLSEKYKVYCVDLLGMGLSSKLDFPCKTTEETIEYFVESLEKWREAMSITEFELGGLSFGGYISTHYAIKYQERVTKLFLISPAGMTKGGETISETEARARDLPWVQRFKLNLKIKAWNDLTSPADYYNRYWFLANFMIRSDMHRKFGEKGKESEFAELLYKFVTRMLRMGSGSDRAVYYLLKSPKAYAHIPLEDLIMEHLKIPVRCYYGDRDWMDPVGAFRVQEAEICDFKVKIIENSGHNISMNNPSMLCQEMLLEANINKSSSSRISV